MKCYKTADGKFLKTTEGKFVGADGSDEFQVIEGSAANEALNAKYVKAAINHNMLTLVFNMKVNQSCTLPGSTALATIILPKYVVEHLKNELSISGLSLKKVTTITKFDFLVDVVLNTNTNTVVLKNADQIIIGKEDEFRVSFSFIL